MIASNNNIRLSEDDIQRFHAGMDRRLKGNLTPDERKRIIARNEVYVAILKRHGGNNPLFCR